MKQHIQSLFQHAFDQLQADNVIPADHQAVIRIERTKDASHGDFACNLAMMLAKKARMKPRDLAEKIIAALPNSEAVDKVEIAGPGFINLFLTSNASHSAITTILEQKQTYGLSQIGAGKSVLIEFVSANPTGPLHVGHGRGAAYGAALADLLKAAGYNVSKEYYVNDAGRQMDILAASIWLRYLDLCGESFTFPSNGYQGDYVWDIAATLHRENQDKYRHAASDVFADVPADEPDGGDKELHIDGLINKMKQLLGEQTARDVLQLGLDAILGDIEHDLGQFGVTYDEWFSEYSLTSNNLVSKAIDQVKDGGFTHEQDGALWFKSSDFGDEKDRVLVKENGALTYLASDIAYHANKLERGFDILINIWGADHHGYIARLKAAIQALGADASKLQVLLVQFATLYRGQEKLQMSTRSGKFVTLRELREEVGKDAARFFYVQRKAEQHLDFDLELAKSQSNDNPVYYIQYAHARICSVFRELSEKGGEWDIAKADLNRLDTSHEAELIKLLSRFPETVENAAKAYEPHQLTYYLRDLAQAFHTYYNAHKFLVDDAELSQSRLSLCKAIQQVLQNGLTIIGVSAPEVM
ncbi:arginine--tRNA ligase [Candidatus Albibeggiatoa sp. nov. NOAA]|uniref:arginine--tRNA ligase n=1 Tax=Candidatus Albibeggiatoa sp. nov. NOAA TaxID=3162724 RepID=UPI0032F2C511|nr:arginine--tRNA ligase [Thiotrichaceae bacterium]